MQQYSVLSLARHALAGHRGWTPAWRKAAPRERYEVVIIGGGGHGLATAYYLAKEHGVSDVAVTDQTMHLRVSGSIAPVIRAAASYELADFVSREPSLEETFLAEYGREAVEASADGR